MGDGRGPSASIFEDWDARACIFDVEGGMEEKK